jgi:hypothetical protein
MHPHGETRQYGTTDAGAVNVVYETGGSRAFGSTGSTSSGLVPGGAPTPPGESGYASRFTYPHMQAGGAQGAGTEYSQVEDVV